MNTDALDALADAIDALEEACGLMKRLDDLYGLTEAQERAYVSMRYDYGRLVDDYNEREEEHLNYEL